EGFLNFRVPIRSYSFADDIHAPRAAVENLIGRYENAPKELIHVRPDELHVRGVGHFGFFREQFRASLWAASVEWLARQGEGAASGVRAHPLSQTAK
ncbi:MAG: hypothetical protein ACJ8J7_11735, partial [Sulfurifustaceae bacterium]